MTIQQLDYVIALDTFRHYVRASQHCLVTQPTLSLQVKKLEDEIGGRLFDRSSTPLKVTPLGEIFIARAREIRHQIDQLKELVSSEQESISGTFNLAIIPTVAPYLLPRFLDQFGRQHADCKLRISESQSEDIIADLYSGKLDLAIMATPVEDQQLREIPIYYERFMLFVPPGHDLLRQKRISVEWVDQRELLLLEQGHCFREQIMELCGRSPEPSERTFEYSAGSIESLKRMVRNEMGATLVPELAVVPEDTATIRRFKEPEPVREISIVVHRNFTKEGLIDALFDVITESLPEGFQLHQRGIRVKWR